MNIVWHGQSFFEIGVKNRKEGEVKIVIDPFEADFVGLKFPKTEADIVLISHNHKDHSNYRAVGGSPFIIDAPGEYEVKDVFIKSVLAFHDNVNGKERGSVIMFTIQAEGMKVGFLSDLGQKELTSQQVDDLGDVDILLIPVGGTYTIGAKDAAEIINQIEPGIVIPMHYKIPGLKIELEDVSKFLKEMGSESIEPLPKAKITQKDLPGEDEEMKIILLVP
ncbi:MAG: MBL fold metallo-hydrolase [Candidatus Pacebacteria bacterium]|nr:MBL fold metallo-hydrolase [Candidatus Paceibacterota bacterium]